MATLSQEQINEIVASHGKWWRGESGGKRADLRSADLSGADLSGAVLRSADLSGADLSGADLSGADLTDAKGLPDFTKQFNLLKKLERTADGYICYKTFGEHYHPPAKWTIEEGTILDEITDMNVLTTCSNGINVATLEWVKRETRGQIWKCLIRFEWLVGAVVPLESDGKFRTSRVQLIEKVPR